MFGAAEGDIAVALDPFSGDHAVLHAGAADVHGRAGIGIVAGATDDRAIGRIGSEGRSSRLPGDALSGHGGVLCVHGCAATAEQQGQQQQGIGAAEEVHGRVPPVIGQLGGAVLLGLLWMDLVRRYMKKLRARDFVWR